MNNTVLLLNVLFLIITGAVSFGDKFLAFFISEEDSKIIYLDDSSYPYLSYFHSLVNENYKLEYYTEQTLDNNYLFKKDEDSWIITSKYQLNVLEIQIFQELIREIEYLNIINTEGGELLTTYLQQLNPVVDNEVEQNDSDFTAEKQNLILMMISSIYFMMIGFSSTIATEVVQEKTSRIIEIILTSVRPKTHFLSKIIIGWLSILIQLGLGGLIILFWLLIRNTYDNGFGIINLLKNYNLLPLSGKTFAELLQGLELTFNHYVIATMCFFFLILGILFIQIVMVILSSYINSIEESGNIQGPCYLVLLVVYYLCLSLNNPQQLTEGLGYYLSFSPLLSMLLMPSRLIVQKVPFHEILLAIFISILALILVITYGSYFYKKGILRTKKIKSSTSK